MLLYLCLLNRLAAAMRTPRHTIRILRTLRHPSLQALLDRRTELEALPRDLRRSETGSSRSAPETRRLWRTLYSSSASERPLGPVRVRSSICFCRISRTAAKLLCALLSCRASRSRRRSNHRRCSRSLRRKTARGREERPRDT